ncbi:MAG TPA: glycogen debranching N-terminal domain-containing protein [Polyangiales bacterium]
MPPQSAQSEAEQRPHGPDGGGQTTRSAAPERGAPLELSTCQDTERLVCARGTLFLVTDRHGNIEPRGARELGLFHDDTRFLSYLILRVRRAELVHLSAETSHDAFNQVDLMVAGLDEGEFLDDPQNFLHVRRRQLLDHGFAEEITFTNFLGHAIEIEAQLEFDVDFADVFEVRGAKRPLRGRKHEPRVTADSVHFEYDGVDGVTYSSDLSITPTPAALSGRSAQIRAQIPAGGSHKIEIGVQPGRHGEKRTSAPAGSFGARTRNVLDESVAFREASTRVRCDNGLIQQFLDQSVIDLYSLQVRSGEDQIVAAGVPWFCCPFGRDSLIASYQSLLLNSSLAIGSLRVLAAHQGRRFDAETEEEPGKIFHELRFGEMARAREMPHRPYYGTIDATPLFVILAHAVYKVTADLSLMRTLAPNIRAALAWIDVRSHEGTSLVSYQRESARGLDNQGWKDSKAGVSFPNGERAESPIALCEIQGYCVDAYNRGASILRALGEEQLAEQYAERSARMRALINQEFWLEQAERYAYAVDGRGRKLDTVVSNLGHLLWSRVPSPERAKRTCDLLLQRSSFSGFGVRTLAEGQPVYNPLSYHNGTVWPHDNALIAKGMANYGLTQYATAIFEGLVEAMGFFPDRRLPELFCGMPRESGSLVRYPVACSPQAWAAGAPYLLLQAILGIHADAPHGRLSIRGASLPPSVEWVSFDGLRIGQSRVNMRLRRVDKRVHVDRFDVTGAPLRAEIELD